MTARRNFLALAASAVGAGAALPVAAVGAVNVPIGDISPPAHPDAELMGWCAAVVKMEADLCWISGEDAPGNDYYATVRAIERTPAKTDEGNRAKLAAAVAYFQPYAPEEDALFGPVLWDAVCALALPPPVAPVAAVDPDADLIRLCAENVESLRAFNEDPRDADDDNPFWLAYERTRDAIDDAKPQTIAGMVAKAKAAKAGALTHRGEEQIEFTCPASVWAWDLVNDLLRLHGRTPA